MADLSRQPNTRQSVNTYFLFPTLKCTSVFFRKSTLVAAIHLIRKAALGMELHLISVIALPAGLAGDWRFCPSPHLAAVFEPVLGLKVFYMPAMMLSQPVKLGESFSFFLFLSFFLEVRAMLHQLATFRTNSD